MLRFIERTEVNPTDVLKNPFVFLRLCASTFVKYSCIELNVWASFEGKNWGRGVEKVDAESREVWEDRNWKCDVLKELTRGT
jgi:hypothetical protein